MTNFPHEPFRPGQRLTAEELNAIRDEVDRLGKVTFVPPLGGASDGGGISIWCGSTWAGWVKLTAHGTGGKYAWTAQVAVEGGTWEDADGDLNGSATDDPAIEVNANASVPLSPNPVVWAWRVPESGDLVFQSGSCA